MTLIDILHKINRYHFQPCGTSNMTYEDWESLASVVQPYLKEGVKICEIGTNMGLSTALLALMAKNYKGKVITIDPFLGKFTDWIDSFWNNMKNLDIDNVTQLRGYSHEMVGQLEDASFDVIFIDGDHSYRAVKRDIELFRPKLKPGGLICGHDCEVIVSDGIIDIKKMHEWDKKDILGIHLGVVMAVSELLPTAQIKGIRIWWAQL